MAQQISKSKPLYVVTDKSPKDLSEHEATYLKNYRATFNKNAAQDGKEGGNMGMGTPNQANKKYALITLPAGTNVTMGVYECEETNEIYFANWNSNKLHGWYVIDGYTLKPSIIKIDPALNFSLEPANKIAAHRVHIRVIYERTSATTRSIKEIILIYTDGGQWQKFINTIASRRSNGFDATRYPYWELRGPHYDATEFIDLPVRPPMYAPVVAPITPTTADAGKPNTIIDKSIQFAYKYVLTDARGTTASPYSNPVAQISSPCNTNNAGLSRGYNITLNAGSALVERIQLFAKFCGGDWYLYDTIERFGPNDPKLDNQYWLRTNDWANYSYNAADNTIIYSYYNDRQTGIIDQEDFKNFQTDCPVISIGLCGAGDAILLGDNLYNYPNLPKIELDKFKASVIDDDESANILQTRKITLYAILRLNGCFTQFIWTNGADKTKRFGGINYSIGPGGENLSYSVGPSFSGGINLTSGPGTFNMGFDPATNDGFRMSLDKTGGFIAYLAGTNYSAVSKQVLVAKDGTMTEMDTIDATSQQQAQLVLNLLGQGGQVVQKFDFIVPPGKYIARIARHNVPTTETYQKTSTWVMGLVTKWTFKNTFGDASQAAQFYNWNNSGLDTIEKELEIDVCAGDFDQWKTAKKNMFFIFIPYIFESGGAIANRRWRFIEGYVSEDEATNIPVEILSYARGADGGLIEYLRYAEYTDHNGHFFMYMAEGTAYKGEVIFKGVANCKPLTQIATTRIDKYSHSDSGYYDALSVSLKDNAGSYGVCNRILIKGKVVDGITGIGYSSIAITPTHGSPTFTDSEGNFSVIIHDTNLNTKGRLYINSSGGAGCFLLPNTGSCFDVFPFDMTGIPCTNCTERIYPTTYNILAKVLNQAFQSVKDGGTYPLSFHVMDLAGRTTFEQPISTVSIPTFMEKGAFILSRIQVALLQDLDLSALNLQNGAGYLILSRASNQRAQSYLQWVGDKIDFLDKDGNVTLDGSGAIRARITIQSLLDYNAQNNYSTTATYQFVKEQILRFYDDGNGNLFKPDSNGLLDFPILGTSFADTVEQTVAVSTTTDGVTTTTTTPINNPGNTIIIPFDKRLLALNGISTTNNGTLSNLNGCGFWIEIQTPRDTSQVQSYTEIVGTYPIINNKLKAQSFLLDTFDTYYQSRNIHIQQCTGKAILHPFASTSISDYFGQDCGSNGRPLIADPLAEQKWYPTDIIKSDEIVNEGRINGLGRFRASNRKQYKGQDMGGIVGLHAQNKILAVICELNWFVTDYDTNFAQARKDGLIVANFSGELGEPDVKVRSKYGCDFEDTGTLLINDIDGYIYFADSKNEAVAVMDYKGAVDITTENKGYFSDKFTYVRDFNQNLTNDPERLYKLMDKVFGYDYKHKELHVSFRKRANLLPDPQYFTNTERGKVIELSETFTFSHSMDHWTQWQTFVPEMYGTLRKSANGQLMIAFAAGTPYLHNDKTVNNFNEFMGVSDTQVVEVPFKIPGTDQYQRRIDQPSKDLTFQNVTIESAVIGYFADRITSTNPNTLSYIPIAWFKKKKNLYYASVLRDMASYPDNQHPVLSQLTDGGGKISGEYCVVRFVRDLQRMNDYSEVDAFYMQYIGLEKSK